MDDLTVEIRTACPSCGGTIRTVLPRHSGPIPREHLPSHRRPCWLIITPDPSGPALQEEPIVLAYRSEGARDAALRPVLRDAIRGLVERAA